MKKSLALILVFAMFVLIFSACGSGAGTGSGANSPAAAPSPSGKSQSGEKPLNVVAVLPNNLGDAGPMDDINKHMLQAADDFDINVSVYEAQESSQYEEVLRTYAREGADMIVASMPAMAESVKKVAPEFPNTKFCILLPLDEIDMENVVTVDFAIWEAYYLAGIMGATMSETGSAGHIVGSEVSSLVANYNAFKEGTKTVNPDMNVYLSNTNTFEDPAKGKEAALSLISQGCDIIITDCASTALGAIEACTEKNVFAMSDSVPHYELAPKTILADTLCQFGAAAYGQVKNFVEGNFASGTHYASLSEGGVDILISPEIAGSLDEAQKAKFEEASRKIEEAAENIRSGKLVIERNINK